MSVVDKTSNIAVRFRVQWTYSGVLGLGKRVARWIHLRIQQYKLDSRFEELTKEAGGKYRIGIEDVVRESPDSGGFVITMSGDSWFMGKYVKPILNESHDRRAEAIESIIQSEFGDILLTNTPVDTEIEVLTYSFGGASLNW